jgi:hypothetical protein
MNGSVTEWLLLKRKGFEALKVDSLSHWKKIMKERFIEWEHTVDRAIAFGFEADRVAFAFIAGFRAALQHLIPGLNPSLFVSFCITEEGGNTPGAINSTLIPEDETKNQWILNGKKSFITGALEADQVFVAASTGQDKQGRKRIKLVVLESETPGITIKTLPPLPFIPEISHGEVSFTNVNLSNDSILAGDGYADYIKPFRIFEEIHVTAAILGYLTRIGMLYSWDRKDLEKIITLIKLVRALWRSDLQAPDTHIAYAGFSHLIQELLTDIKPHWEKVPKEVRVCWERDQAILGIAEKAGKKRLENAWMSFGG